MQATEWARYMVAECGLDDAVGPVHISETAARQGLLSEQLKQRVDEQVSWWMEDTCEAQVH
jgi:ATP-dependent Zn protease